MSASELYTLVNRSIELLAWPIVALVLAAMLRAPVMSLLNRFALLEGSVGGVSFKVSLEKYVRDTVTRAIDLEKNGRADEAQALVKSASNIASLMYGLSDADIAHLLSLADGASPPSRWGKIHLVRAGLVELDGGHLTPQGKEFVEVFIRPALRAQEVK
jgi:hypothetical protein